MRKLSIAVFLVVALFLSSACATSVPQNGSVSVDAPVDHDLFLTGETVAINARVNGDILAAAGTVVINAPVTGDLLVLAEEVTINAPIGGAVTAVGWLVRVRADVGGRILVAAATVNVGGRANKLVALGWTVGISVSTVIEKYAYVAAGSVEFNGFVRGELRVVTNDFKGTGVAGSTIHDTIETQIPTWVSVIFRDITGPYAGVQLLLNVLISLGFIVLGVILLALFPRQFSIVHDELLRCPVRDAVTGFVLIVGVGITCVLFMVTLVGLPIAAVLAMLLITCSMLSPLLVSLALGRKIRAAIGLKLGDSWSFVLGFAILSLLSSLAVVGWLVYVVAVSLGVGAIFRAVVETWGLPSWR